MHTLICVTFSLPAGVRGWLRLLLVALPGIFCLPLCLVSGSQVSDRCPLGYLLALLNAVQKNVSDRDLSGVRLSVRLSACKYFLLPRLLQDHWAFFLNLVRIFPSMFSCVITETNSAPSTNMAAVGHLACFLLPHLLKSR